MSEESPKRSRWPKEAQVLFEGALVAAAVIAYLVVAYMNFIEGRVRGPYAVPRYYQLGDFDQFPPVEGKFDLNRDLDNFDVEALRQVSGKNIPNSEKESTVPPVPADN